MSQAPPPTGLPHPMPPASDPADKVGPPAIALIVAMSIGIALGVLGLVFNVLGIGFGAQQGGEQGAMTMFSGGLGIVQALVGIVLGVVIIMGALKMKRLESYSFAMTASILAMIPCISPCCILGLPFGIWALVVLNDEQVKRAFQG